MFHQIIQTLQIFWQVLFNSLWQTVLALAGIVGIPIAIIKSIDNSSKPPKVKKVWKIITVVVTMLIIVLISGGIYVSLPSNQNPLATSSPTVASFSSTPGFTATPSSQPSPTATPTSQVTPNTTPTLAADGTIPENKPLTCSTCSGGNDPIHFTIDSITVDNANGRTVWNATLNNVSGNTYDVVNNGITLQISSGTTPPVQATGYSSTYMNPGDKASIHLTFTVFILKGVQYTFSVHLNMSDASIDMPFDPVNLSFLTATSTSQITSAVTPTALAADGTIPENKPLTCSTCSGGNDPIHFTIDSITVDNANGRTVWNATLNNVSGNTYDVVNNGITLQISSGTTPPVQATGYSSTYMNPGDKASIHLTFTVFILKGVQYTFSVHLNMSDASINMIFDPVNLPF